MFLTPQLIKQKGEDCYPQSCNFYEKFEIFNVKKYCQTARRKFTKHLKEYHCSPIFFEVVHLRFSQVQQLLL